MQGEPTGLEGRSEELEKMDVVEDVDSKNKVDHRKKELVLQSRRINEFPHMPPHVGNVLKEKWKQDLQDIEQSRSDLLPEHHKTQRRSQKLQSTQDRTKQCKKNLGKWAEDTEPLRNVITDADAKMEDYGPKST